KTDNLEAIVWQLYDAGFRPNIKYGAGKLRWVNLTVKQVHLRHKEPEHDRLGNRRHDGGA
ncbi:MAG: hypothetical protein ACKPKO_10620, partial [Candidatus Fonsibacter sp.]